MGTRRVSTGDLEIYEIRFVIHPKDHEPDWTDPEFGVCRTCGIGRIREVGPDDEPRT